MPAILRVLLAALVLLVPARYAAAHDYWLEFSPLRVEPMSDVALTLHVGEDFVAEKEKVMELARMVVFRRVSAAGEEDLLAGASEGQRPLARVRLAPGGHLIVLERNASHIEMRARKFNRYLKHEGLSAAFADRKRARERLRRARERYTRHLKAFMQVGDAADGTSMKVLGQRLELVPEGDLATLRPGDRFAMTLRFEGKPLPGAMIEAFVRMPGGEARGQKMTSDADGRVEFTALATGAWVVRTVHMQRCVRCKDADWESFWAGYSFAVRATPA